MAERLVFDVMKNGKLLCCIHFRWGAYTLSVYQHALDIVKGLKKYGYTPQKTDDETLQILINTLEDIHTDFESISNAEGEEIPLHVHTHGGVSRDDWEVMEKRGFKFNKEDISASDGILIVDDVTIDHAHDWAEDIEEFDLDEEYVTNGMYSDMSQEEVLDLEPKFKFDEIMRVSDMPFSLVTLDRPKFTDLDPIIRWMLTTDHRNFVLGRYDDDSLLTIFC